MDFSLASSSFVDDSRTTAARAGDRYVTYLGFVLLGYALLGKGFAYLGVPPIFVGEISLVIGLGVVLAGCRRLPILRTPLGITLLLFVAWGVARTVPFISVYKVEALRDGAVWGYSAYALIIASLIAQEPKRLAQLLSMFRKFVGYFLWLAPLACLATRIGTPRLPWTADVMIVHIKGGDLLVQLTGVFCFIAVIGTDLQPWMPVLLVPLMLGLNVQGRAGIVTFLVGVCIVTVLKPYSRFVVRLWIAIAVLMMLLWVTDLHFRYEQDDSRDVSFDQLVSGVTSIFGASDHASLDGSREWRLKWWEKIENYTFHGPYFWTGKGYGVNLAEDDGFVVDEGSTLRNPHNAHMTFLARGGVPGLAIWIATQACFAIAIGYGYVRARMAGERNWANVFLFLFVFWIAFIVNASFDVFLEGPMGGIWFWSVYGTGLGALWVFRHSPEILDDVPALADDPSR